MTTKTEAPKLSRTLTVIQHAALKRRDALLARIKPLQNEIAQLDAILLAGAPSDGELFPEENGSDNE
jgi:hypothetical protein